MKNELTSIADIMQKNPKLLSINEKIQKNISAEQNSRQKVYSGEAQKRDLNCRYCGKELNKIYIKLPIPVKGVQHREYIDNCQCEYSKLSFMEKESASEKLSQKANLPERFKNATFALSDKNRDKINFVKALQFAKSFDKKNGKGVQFCGTVGRGKTHLMCCIANKLIERGISVYFTTYSDLAKGYFKDHEIIKKVSRFDFLILDEFGTCKITDYSNETLKTIINSLYQDKKCMGITINPDVLTKLAKETDLKPSRDRFKEMLDLNLEFNGESFRGK